MRTKPTTQAQPTSKRFAEQLSGLSKARLYELAKALKIPKRSHMNKAQLLAALKQQQGKVKQLLAKVKHHPSPQAKPAIQQGEIKAKAPKPAPQSAAKHDSDRHHADWHGESGPDLPESYNQTVLRAMPKDAHTVYVYWDIDEQTAQRLQQNPSQQTVLRVYGKAKQPEIELAVSLQPGRQYLELEPNRTYAFELGTISRGNRYATLVRSNLLTLPPESEHVYGTHPAGRDTSEKSSPHPAASWMTPSSTLSRK